MAKITLAAGTSHTPLLTFGSQLWKEYSTRDRKNQRLNLSDGSYLSFDDLMKKVGGRYAGEATVEKFEAKEAICKTALDRIGQAIRDANPDVVVVFTDDKSELFSRANTPAISIYYGDTIVTRPFSSKMMDLDDPPPYFATMVKNYAMDQARTFPAMANFGRELIERLIDKHIDVGAAAQVEDPTKSGFGHGVGFVIQRFFGGKEIPVVPILLNTYYPPNAPVPARCYDIGRALRAAIDESKSDLKVALVASGGLSHFIVDEGLDHRIINAFRSGPIRDLRDIPVGALNSGSSEIRNWIAMGGAIEDMKNEWLEYQPLYRTEAGTGIGAAFGIWR